MAKDHSKHFSQKEVHSPRAADLNMGYALLPPRSLKGVTVVAFLSPVEQISWVNCNAGLGEKKGREEQEEEGSLRQETEAGLQDIMSPFELV